MTPLEHLEVISETTKGEEAFRLVEQLKPDLLITEISLKDLSGLEILQKIKEKGLETKVLILSNFFDEHDILSGYERGAMGYLPKSVDDQNLILAIGKIAKGEIYYHQSVLNVLGSSLIQRKLSSRNTIDLTEREMEILREVCEGATNKEIAEKLFISVRTVDAHRRNIMKKLGVKNSVQLVKVSLEKKLI